MRFPLSARRPRTKPHSRSAGYPCGFSCRGDIGSSIIGRSASAHAQVDNKPAVTPGEVVKALQQNWRAEKESARVYRELAESEKSDRRKAVLLRLAEAEERHASRWEKRLLELGAGVPATKDDLGKRLRRWINRHVSTEIATRPSRPGRWAATLKLRLFSRNLPARKKRTRGCCKTSRPCWVRAPRSI